MIDVARVSDDVPRFFTATLNRWFPHQRQIMSECFKSLGDQFCVIRACKVLKIVTSTENL